MPLDTRELRHQALKPEKVETPEQITPLQAAMLRLIVKPTSKQFYLSPKDATVLFAHIRSLETETAQQQDHIADLEAQLEHLQKQVVSLSHITKPAALYMVESPKNREES